MKLLPAILAASRLWNRVTLTWDLARHLLGEPMRPGRRVKQHQPASQRPDDQGREHRGGEQEQAALQ